MELTIHDLKANYATYTGAFRRAKDQAVTATRSSPAGASPPLTEAPPAPNLATVLSPDSYATRSIELSGALGLAILDDPTLLEGIPNGCTLFLLPADEPAYLELSLELGIAAIREGRNVYFKHVPAGFGKDFGDEE
jgi:hypothetical protein